MGDFFFLPPGSRGGISFRRYLFHENALTRHEIRDINGQPSLPGKSIGQKTNIGQNPSENIGYYYYHSFHGIPRRDIGLKTVNSIFGAVWCFIVDRTCARKKWSDDCTAKPPDIYLTLDTALRSHLAINWLSRLEAWDW